MFQWLKNIIAIFITFTSIARADSRLPIAHLTDHEPNYKGAELPHESYVAFETKHLAKSQVVWLNFDWLHEHGYYVDGQGLTPEFEKEILHALGWAVPQEGDDPSLFNDETRTFFADRYGGEGIGENFGSGRAASLGEIQIKGIGQTPLVGKGTGFSHSHGGASLEEAVREAIWGEVNHHELPSGSNRIVAIIDSGTYTDWSKSNKPGVSGFEKRALIIRDDPLRPAHLIADPLPGEAAGKLKTRIKEHFTRYLNHVAETEGAGFQTAEKAVDEYINRTAKQYATAQAKRIYMGTTSPSNYDFRGKFLDFGTETYLPSDQPVHVVGHVQPFGETKRLKENLLTPLVELSGGNMKLASIKFDRTYEETLNQEFLKLTGAPPELVEKMMRTQPAQKLAKSLREFRTQEFSRTKVYMDRQIPEELKQSQFGGLMKGAVDSPNLLKILDERAPQMKSSIKKDLAQNYREFMNTLTETAKREGMKPEALKTYLRESTAIMHKDVSNLLRPNLINRSIEVVADYQKTGNRSAIWDEIDRQIEHSIRNPYAKNPYEIVISRKPNRVAGTIEQRIFNLKKNSFRDETISLRKILPTAGSQCAGIAEDLKKVIP